MAPPRVGPILTVRVTDDTLAAIDHIATESGRPRAEVARVLLESAIDAGWWVE